MDKDLKVKNGEGDSPEVNNSTKEYQNPSNESREEKKSKQADLMFQVAKKRIEKISYDKERDTIFVKIPFRGGFEDVPIGSKKFERFLSRVYNETFSTSPNKTSITQCITLLEGYAQEKSPNRKVCLRTGGDDKEIKIFLADESGSIVSITPGEWSIEKKESQKELFLRTTGMKPLPIPERGGDYTLLREFLHLESERDWFLIVSFICAAFRSFGPYPLLVFISEQGSGKSTIAKMIKSIVDPNKSEKARLQRDDKDLFVMAEHNHLLIFDNISKIPIGKSDLLCTLSTGGGSFLRSLFTNDEAKIFEQQRPVILNGITDFVNQGDLLDRSLLIRLPRIPEGKRKPERQLWEDFDRKLPLILGGFFDLMAEALKYHPMEVDNLPRMADFCQWGAAIEKATGWEPGAVLNAYRENKEIESEVLLESSLVGMAIMEHITEFTGTARELLNLFNEKVEEEKRREKGWPKSARQMGGMLRRIAPTLRTEGITVETDVPIGRGERKNSKGIVLKNFEKQCSPRSPNESGEHGEHVNQKVYNEESREKESLPKEEQGLELY